MNEKQTFSGTYQVGNNSEKEFEITYNNSPEKEENTAQLLKLLNSPWQLIKNGGKFGVNSVKRFFTVLFLFGTCNTILFFYALATLFGSGFAFGKLAFVFLVLIIGVALTVFASYKTYQYVVIDTIRVIYENLASLYKKLTDLLVDKTEAVFDGKVNLNSQQFSKAIDIGKTVHQTYSGLPSFLRKGIVLILNKIPLVEMLTELKEDIA